MKTPKIGSMVKVRWIDAFSYIDDEKYVINTTRGEWNGVYTEVVEGRKFKFADIIQESTESSFTKSSGHPNNGVRMPYQWILSIEEI